LARSGRDWHTLLEFCGLVGCLLADEDGVYDPRLPNRERSEIAITSEGRVKVVIGTGPSGQGHETSFAQVVGAVLAVSVETVDVVTGDTDIVSLGGGSHSGRSMRHSATLFAKAAPELIANGKRVAARLLDTSTDQVTFADGRFSAPPHNRSFDFLELAKEASRLGEGELAVTTDNDMHDPVSPNGCAVCEVEVDPETGLAEIARYSVVDDVGRCIKPLRGCTEAHASRKQL
jgi:carbon-monoxide dehydrogenase large subunit